MRKLVLGLTILAVLGMTSTAMAANSGTVNFIGAISSATCDLKVTNASGAEIPTADLGTISTTGIPTSVQFKLVPSDNACLAKNGAQISWTSNNLTTQGFNNVTMGGTNAYMALLTSNAQETGANSYVKSGQATFNYQVTSGGIRFFGYSASLVKPTGIVTPGAFSTSASYVVTYK